MKILNSILILLAWAFAHSPAFSQIGEFQGDIKITDNLDNDRFNFSHSSMFSHYTITDGTFAGIVGLVSEQFLNGGVLEILGVSDNRLSLWGNFGGLGSKLIINHDDDDLLTLGSNQFDGFSIKRFYGQMKIRSVGNVDITAEDVNNTGAIQAGNAPYDMIALENDGPNLADDITWHIGIATGIEQSGGVGGLDDYDYVNALTFSLTEPGTSPFYKALIEDDGDFHQISDQRLKENINEIQEGVKTVMKLAPKSYNFKERKDNKKNYGFLAQEIQQVLPELVLTMKNPESSEETLLLNYIGLIPYLTAAIQDQQEVIKSSLL